MATIKFEDFVNAIRNQESAGSVTDNQMQIQRGTFDRFKQGKESWDNPYDKTKVANRYIDYLRRTTGGDPEMMAAGYFGGEGGLDKNNWDRTDANGKSISSYVQDIHKRLAQNATGNKLSDIDAELSALPNAAQLDKELSTLPDSNSQDNPSTTFMGYTPQEIYRGMKMPAEIAGSMAGGVMGMGAGPLGAVAGAGLGAMGANRAYQAVGQMTGMLPNETTGQAVNEIASSGLSGATGEMGGQIISKVVEKAAPTITNTIRDWIAGRPTVQAQQDMVATGIGLTAPEAGGHGLGWQKVLSSVPGSEEKFGAKFTTQMEQAGNALQNEVERLASGAILTKQGVGERVSTTYRQVVNNAFAARSTQGRADFAITDAMMNNRPYIRVDNFLSQLRTEIGNLQAMHTAAGTAKARQLTVAYNTLRRDFPTGQLTGYSLNAQMAAYGAAAHGNGTIFARLAPDAADKAMFGRIYRSLDADLGIAANHYNTMQGAVGSSLENARAAWATNTQYLRQLRDNTIGSMLGTTKTPDPTSVYNRMTNLNPATMRQVTNALDTVDPGVMNEVRGRYIQDILEGSTNTGGAKLGELNPTTLHKALEKNPERFRALFDQSTVNQLDAISRQMERIIRSGAGTPNRTIERISRYGAGGLAMYPALYGNFGQAFVNAGVAGAFYLSASQLGRILAMPEGRIAINTMMSRTASPAVVARAASNIIQFADKNYGEEE